MKKLCLALIMLSVCLTGCSSGPAGVPEGATLIADGYPPIVFNATGPGTLFIRDQAADKVVYYIVMRGGDNLVLDGTSGRPIINGKMQPDVGMRTYANYQLFFKQ